jgi:hypothetical protein
LRIAIVDSAFVSILASNWSVDYTFNCIASCSSAAIWALVNKWGINAFSRRNIAFFSCACIVIITSFLGMNAVSINTRINCASVFVITIDWSVNASRVRIARIFCVGIVVIAINCNVFASSCFVARISGASIAVITILLSALALTVYARFSGTCVIVITTKDVLALSINTFVNCASIVIITIDRSIYASFSWNTRIYSARIFIVTKSVIWSVLTSAMSIASINSARNTIIAILWCIDNA